MTQSGETQLQSAPSQESEITAITVPKSKGAGTRTLFKDRRGRFTKALRDPSNPLSGHARTKRVREFLTGPSNPKDPNSKTREEEIHESMFELITKDKSEKTATARVNAAKLMFETGYGKPGLSDDEMKAQEKNAIRTIVLAIPPDVKPAEPKPERPTQPVFGKHDIAFIEGEVVSTNEPKETK